MASISADTFEVGTFSNPMIMKDTSRKRRVRTFYFYPSTMNDGDQPWAVKDLKKGSTIRVPHKMALAMLHAYLAWQSVQRRQK